MATCASNPIPLTDLPMDVHALVGRRLIISWSCTRRSRDIGGDHALERVQFKVSVQPLDRQHAMIEAWLESGPGGTRTRTILASTSRPCHLSGDDRMTHIDVAGNDGQRILTLSITPDGSCIVYAQSTLVREAGLGGGAYDPPTLLPPGDQRVAQSA